MTTKGWHHDEGGPRSRVSLRGPSRLSAVLRVESCKDIGNRVSAGSLNRQIELRARGRAKRRQVRSRCVPGDPARPCDQAASCSHPEVSMTVAQRIPEQEWTTERFLATDQHEFGDAWRYELVDGRIVAHVAPSPEHGAILAGLTGALASRLRGNPNSCRPESGSGAVPRSAQHATARIPDALIRCSEHRRVMFEVISPSELRNWTERDAKRRDLQGGRRCPGDRRAVPGRASVPYLSPPARRYLGHRGPGRP